MIDTIKNYDIIEIRKANVYEKRITGKVCHQCQAPIRQYAPCAVIRWVAERIIRYYICPDCFKKHEDEYRAILLKKLDTFNCIKLGMLYDKTA